LNDIKANSKLTVMLLLAIGLRLASIRKLQEGGSFVAEDPEPALVQRFFAEARLPYDATFVSIGCFRGTAGLQKLAECFAHPDGRVAILDQRRLLCDIKVAAHEDIQVLARRGSDRRRLSECSRCFSWPSQEQTIEQALLRAADDAKRYAEARIYRPLVAADILHFT
jgi:hypothetical protein